MMTEGKAVRMVLNDPAEVTDFESLYWVGINLLTLQSCFDKGFIRWDGQKLIATPLGKRACGGDTHE